MNNSLSIGIALITHKAKKHLPFCLPPLLQSSLKPRIVVVNSSSEDGTLELAQQMGVETLLIPRHEFNHGTAREAVRRYLNTDIIVFMTPDAYFINHQLLELLVQPLIENKASISYARQIPHEGADFFETFGRSFNYPDKSHVRGIENINTYGIYTFFCSNACAAYLNAALNEVEGFQATLFGEDTIAVAKLLRRGHKIAYTAEAIVKHSHRYNLLQEFKRHFDIGLVRKEQASLLFAPGKDSKRGRQYFWQLFASALKSQPILLPHVILHVLSKLSGYQLGRLCYKAPNRIKSFFSSQEFYWKSINK